MTSSLRQLLAMSDAELENTLDDTTPLDPAKWPLEWYLAELQRRRAEKQTATIVHLTWAIAVMSAISTVFVVLSALHVVG